MKINVTKSYLPRRENFDRYVDRIFANGWLTNFGELHAELTNRLRKHLGVPYILPIVNGTVAIQIALKLLQSPGKKIITTPFSFVATTSSIVWEGFEPIFADICPDTFNLDPDRVEEILQGERDEIAAILPVHVYGNCCDVERFQRISEKYGVPVIYDAAHAFGVTINGQSVLNYGMTSILSFHATKVFHTIEGGALCFTDENLYHRAKRLINFGITGPDQIEGLGVNGKMNEFQAAMGLAVLEEMPKIVAGRKHAFETYEKLLNPSLLTPARWNGSRNHSYFPTIWRNETTVLNVQSELAKKDVGSRRYFYPSLSGLNYLKGGLTPIGNDISKRILCLPMYAGLQPSDQKDIADTVNELVRADELHRI